MPKTVPNYSNTIIYKLCCNNPEITDIYIGHTTNFIMSKNQHKNNCKNPNLRCYNYYVYQFIRENGGFDNWAMIEIVKVNCIDKKEAAKYERFYLYELKATLNKVVPTRTKQEYYNDNKESIVKYKKEYYESNIEVISEKHKEYYKSNKEVIKERAKCFYESNKNIILEKQKNNIMCICGCEITKNHLNRHFRTQKHQAFILANLQ